MSHVTVAPWPEDDPGAALLKLQGEARRLGRRGALVVLLGIVPALAWLAWAPLASAVVAPAHVKVDLERRPVQHAEGGTVRSVLVRDGERVKAGQPLLTLGDVAIDADLQRLDYRVAAERAGLARLDAEQAGAAAIAWPSEVLAAARESATVAAQMNKEQALFAARREALVGQTALLAAQQAKLRQERDSLRAQIEQAGESLRHQASELDNNRKLQSDGFVAATRVSQLEASVSDYRVKIEERRSDLARAEQRMIDNDLRARGMAGDYRQQASDQLKVAQVRLAELQQELRKAQDQSRRQVIAAPADGEVMNLRFTSPGAVVPPRETIADIVPADPRLLVEARIRTEDVNRVVVGQAAEIRLTAYTSRTARLVAGRVFYVAPDRLVDRASGLAYYTAVIEAAPAALAAAGDLKLQAGMPAEVYIQGEQRSVLDYLAEPVTQVLDRAGRER